MVHEEERRPVRCSLESRVEPREPLGTQDTMMLTRYSGIKADESDRVLVDHIVGKGCPRSREVRVIRESGEKDVALVMVAWNEVHGWVQRREDLTQGLILLDGAMVGEIPRREHYVRTRLEAVDMRHGFLKLRIRGHSPLTELIVLDNMQVRDLRDEHGFSPPHCSVWLLSDALPHISPTMASRWRCAVLCCPSSLMAEATVAYHRRPRLVRLLLPPAGRGVDPFEEALLLLLTGDEKHGPAVSTGAMSCRRKVSPSVM